MTNQDIGGLFASAAALAAKFRGGVDQRLQRPLNDYSASLATFKEPLPKEGMEMPEVLTELEIKAEPGLHMPTGPRFFGWVMGGSHPVGVATDFLTSAWGQNAGNHMAAPSASAVEAVTASWLLELLDLPRESSVGFVTGATGANFTCLAAARSSLLRGVGWDVDALGLFGAPPITVIIGDDAHTTVFSSLQYLGLGHERVVRIATDRDGRMKPHDFELALQNVESPCLVILQAGQINTGAFDDFETLVPIAKQKGAWVHVDGAFGLWARASEVRRHLADGVELADSWATDGHKFLQTPYDSGYAIVRDEEAHRRSMSITASYLPLAAAHERDPSQYVPELSRRARGFSTWAVIKHFGKSGIAGIVDNACDSADEIATALSREPGINVLNTIDLNQVVVSFSNPVYGMRNDDCTASVIARVQENGEIFAGGARWKGQGVMRVSVCNSNTNLRQARRAAAAIIAAYRAVAKADHEIA
ncbi:pyridoxal phosphate-dependent decarboxylase family protein [Pararhizobium qamdonense]|uniref:pyridoxal phosphate-dependent decarboxylase family protein n=1 Tax=Pararhizobium qamdonense TaxID=3031126 RepID=UPI0023E1F083|nr:aspartate aminotransferase family protein [Pararhizobium qamdonense]